MFYLPTTPAVLLLFLSAIASSVDAGELIGSIVDSESHQPVAARVYVHSEQGEWLFVESASDEGSAIPYREQWVPIDGSVELHTTVSAHPFRIELVPGKYTITIERGKEYLPLTRVIEIGEGDSRETLQIRRWVNMAKRGWYSGETHVHRRIRELPNVMLAEDLNVAFPVTFWTTQANEQPGLEPSPLRRQGLSPFGPRVDRGSAPIVIDESHIMFPRNTEYEIFSVGGKRHVLGAVFILNHKSRFKTGMPPVAEIARQAHSEGALLDLDKHSWPWSMMLVPIARIDLYELSNNSVWRTQFGFRGSTALLPDYMKVEIDEKGMTEWGWLNFGFENYYALLNCGFRLQPTAGTASGVHPVPLGHSRVYVYPGERFEADSWLDGLKAGRSFVTTGPMLNVQVDSKLPGYQFTHKTDGEYSFEVGGQVLSSKALDRIEIIINGEVVKSVKPENRATDPGAFESSLDLEVQVDRTSWIVVRAIQSGSEGRHRFAHSAPWHISVGGKRIRPRKREVDYLIGRVEREIERNRGVLSDQSMDEFKRALRIYHEIAKRAMGRRKKA